MGIQNAVRSGADARKYAPPEVRLADRLTRLRAAPLDIPDDEPPPDPTPTGVMIDLKKIETEMGDKLRDLALSAKALNFDDMMELASGICPDGMQPHEIALKISTWAGTKLAKPVTGDEVQNDAPSTSSNPNVSSAPMQSSNPMEDLQRADTTQ